MEDYKALEAFFKRTNGIVNYSANTLIGKFFLVFFQFFYISNIQPNFEIMFRLDRTLGKGHSHEASANQSAYWKSKTVEERFTAALYLNSIAYNFDVKNPPRLDRTAFKTRKHKSK